MKLKNIVLLAGLSLSLTACLQTREELRGGASGEGGQKAQNEMQQEQVRSGSAPVEVSSDDEFKELRNRIDMLENQIAQNNANNNSGVEDRQRQNQELDRRFRAFEEAIKNMDIQVLGLVKEVSDLKKKDLADSQAAANTPPKGQFDRGEDLFDKKEWQEAILAYQAYRDGNPKGKNYAEATFKIGVSFQELKMNDEAKAFYNEVLAKAPKSPQAKKAKTRLKTLK